MTISGRLEELAAQIKEYCQFLEDELTNLKGARRHLETLAAELKRLEVVGGAVVTNESITAPPATIEKTPGNRCNFPIF